MIDQNDENKMSGVIIKPAFCKCENKDTDQLGGKRAFDKRLCFRNMYSAIPLPHKSEISVVVQSGLC